MSRLPLIYKIWMFLLLFAGTALIVNLYASDKIDITELQKKRGNVVNAECFEFRSSVGIKLLVNYSGSPEQDFINLPIDVNCPSLLPEFIGGMIEITFFENVYFGIAVNNKVVIETEQALSSFNNKADLIIFVSFIVVVCMLALYFKGKHVTSKST